MSFVGSVSWNFLKSFVKAAGTVVAVALVPEVAVVLLLLGEAKYAGCAIITYFPEDLFDSDLWHKIYNNADKEMSELAEVSRVALERGPLGLIGYLGQGYADKVQTPEGIASTTGEALGTFTGTAMAKKILSPEGQAKVSDIKEDLEDTFTKKTINEGVDVNGNKLNKKLSELNEKFRGDKYKRKGTYERSLDKFDRDDLIKTNYDSTAKLDENLDGHITDNSSYSGNTTYWQNKRATTARNEVPAVDSDTIMQKVITEDTYQKYIKGEYNTINGCVSKASDVAPYTSTPKEAYTNLRLDYKETTFDPAGQKDMYVVRYTSSEVPTNTDIPTLANDYKPPCAENGYVSSPEHVVPEYDNKLVGASGYGVEPSEAVIYKLSPDGTERMAAYWSETEGWSCVKI